VKADVETEVLGPRYDKLIPCLTMSTVENKFDEATRVIACNEIMIRLIITAFNFDARLRPYAPLRVVDSIAGFAFEMVTSLNAEVQREVYIFSCQLAD